MLLVIDNYDSFVHNLARYFRRLGQTTNVIRNDKVSVAEVRRLQPDALVLSPGPGTPDDAGASLEIVREFASELPILGVCLGHQTIAQAFGGRVLRSSEPMHGRCSWVEHDGVGIFEGLASPLRVGRYHSLVVDGIDEQFRTTATIEDGTVMAFAHRELPIMGVQFHPESVLTQHGYQMLANFLRLAKLVPSDVPAQEWDDSAFPDSPRDASTEQPDWPTDPISF